MKNKVKKIIKPFYLLASWMLTPIWGILLIVLSLYSRFKKKSMVGIGPEPLINNKYHKLALQKSGYTAETFVNQVYFITNDFDFRGDLVTGFLGIRHYVLFIRCLLRYRIVYIYFTGGPLAWTPLKWYEASLFRLAKIKMVVMPYGGDVYDILRCRSLIYRNAILNDYPLFQKSARNLIVKKIEYWTQNADHIIGGCDWVDYLVHWDTLMTAHFSIDTEKLIPLPTDRVKKKGALRVLHAPNHKMIKGTSFIVEAIESLKNEGHDIELVLVTKRPNSEVLAEIRNCDVVADQLIIGWHGIFALEAMAIGRPTICYLRSDLIELYHSARLIHSDNLPFINANILTIKETLKELIKMDANEFSSMQRNAIRYVEENHSLIKVGEVFDRINKSLNIIV